VTDLSGYISHFEVFIKRAQFTDEMEKVHLFVNGFDNPYTGINLPDYERLAPLSLR
jgi:hypothetical protein